MQLEQLEQTLHCRFYLDFLRPQRMTPCMPSAYNAMAAKYAVPATFCERDNSGGVGGAL